MESAAPVTSPDAQPSAEPDRRRPASSHPTRRRIFQFIFSLFVVLMLLVMLELGRIFLTWVLLQNAASTAIRYTITGQYDTQKYDLDLLVPCYEYDSTLPHGTYLAPLYTPPGLPSASLAVQVFNPAPGLNAPAEDFQMVVVNNALLDGSAIFPAGTPQHSMFAFQPRRAYEDIYLGDMLLLQRGQPFTPEVINVLNGQTVKVFALNPDESLYATWYGSDNAEKDCFPSDMSLNDRVDLLRLASIYDKARSAAAGVPLEPSLTGSGSRLEFVRFLRDFWSNPSPRQDNPGWFNVTICSRRERRYATDISSTDGLSYVPAETIIHRSMTDPRTDTPYATLRFDFFPGRGYSPYMDDAGMPGPDMPGGACLLKEIPSPMSESYPYMLNNWNVAWADAGDAEEVVDLVITYNHPLMFLPGRFVQLQAQRSAVNEKFRLTSKDGTLRYTGVSGMPASIPPTPISNTNMVDYHP